MANRQGAPMLGRQEGLGVSSVLQNRRILHMTNNLPDLVVLMSVSFLLFEKIPGNLFSKVVEKLYRMPSE